MARSAAAAAAYDGRSTTGGNAASHGAFPNPRMHSPTVRATESKVRAMQAQVALAEMYRRGNGVEQDPLSAYMWYLVSEKMNSEQREEISAAKRQVGATLNPEQIVEAQNQATARLKKVKRPASVAVGMGAAIGATS